MGIAAVSARPCLLHADLLRAKRSEAGLQPHQLDVDSRSAVGTLRFWAVELLGSWGGGNSIGPWVLGDGSGSGPFVQSRHEAQMDPHMATCHWLLALTEKEAGCDWLCPAVPNVLVRPAPVQAGRSERSCSLLVGWCTVWRHAMLAVAAQQGHT